MKNTDVNDLESAKGHIRNVIECHEVGSEIHHTLTLAVDQIDDALEELNKDDSIGNLGAWRNDA